MSKLEALITLMDEARGARRSQTSLNRLRRACKTLGLEEKDIQIIETREDYPSPQGELYRHVRPAKSEAVHLKGAKQKMAENHTPTPWFVAYGSIYTDPEGRAVRLVLADREESKTTPTERDANIKFVALAVNSYDALRDALRDIVADYNDAGLSGITQASINKARRALGELA